jgi:hypothetical protein
MQTDNKLYWNLKEASYFMEMSCIMQSLGCTRGLSQLVNTKYVLWFQWFFSANQLNVSAQVFLLSNTSMKSVHYLNLLQFIICLVLCLSKDIIAWKNLVKSLRKCHPWKIRQCNIFHLGATSKLVKPEICPLELQVASLAKPNACLCWDFNKASCLSCWHRLVLNR